MHAGQQRGGVFARGTRSSLATSIALVAESLNAVVGLPGVGDNGDTGLNMGSRTGAATRQTRQRESPSRTGHSPGAC